MRLAEKKGYQLDGLSLAEMKAIDMRLTKDVFSVLNPEYAVRSRTSFGGTAPDLVRRSVAAARKRFLS